MLEGHALKRPYPDPRREERHRPEDRPRREELHRREDRPRREELHRREDRPRREEHHRRDIPGPPIDTVVTYLNNNPFVKDLCESTAAIHARASEWGKRVGWEECKKWYKVKQAELIASHNTALAERDTEITTLRAEVASLTTRLTNATKREERKAFFIAKKLKK